MIKSGLCSVTFREKTPEEIIALGVNVGIDGIEWGADRHVLPGDVETARRVGQWTRAAGLDVVSYGSYYMAFNNPGDPPADFSPEMDTAVALGAPVIRIWAGSLAMEKTPDYFQVVVEQSRLLAEAAQKVGIKVAYEFHPNTFSETFEGTLKLIEAVDHPNLYTYWQPPHGSDLHQRLNGIAALRKYLLHLHVFHWTADPEPYTRRPLAEGAAIWPPCLQSIDEPDVPRYALLEFVSADDPEQFRHDASTLKLWLESISSK